MDLWTLLVVNLFQSFWLAVLGLVALFYLILISGKVSQVTTINFLIIFVLAMALGYGFSLVTIILYRTSISFSLL